MASWGNLAEKKKWLHKLVEKAYLQKKKNHVTMEKM